MLFRSVSQSRYHESKTQTGETIPYVREQLSLFPDATDSNVQREGNNKPSGSSTTYDSYFDSDPYGDDVTHFERLMSEQKHIKLSGTTTIKSSRDIAYLFRSLESAPAENVFAVLIDKTGRYKVLYVSSGATNQSVIDIKLIAAAAKEFGAAKVTFVHNHPSGQLKTSQADVNIHRKLTEAFEGIAEVMEGIIINLDSGKYVEFNGSGYEDVLETRKDAPSREVNAKVFAFDRQVLYTKSSNLDIIKSSADIAKLLSRFKRGTGKKFIVMILGGRNEITRTFITEDISAATYYH